MKLRWHLYVLPFTFLIIAFYFAFHLVQGERGISRLFEVNQEIKKGEQMLSDLVEQREFLEKKVQSISTQEIEADTLDELAREQQGVLLPEEFIIYN